MAAARMSSGWEGWHSLSMRGAWVRWNRGAQSVAGSLAASTGSTSMAANISSCSSSSPSCIASILVQPISAITAVSDGVQACKAHACWPGLLPDHQAGGQALTSHARLPSQQSSSPTHIFMNKKTDSMNKQDVATAMHDVACKSQDAAIICRLHDRSAERSTTRAGWPLLNRP